MSHFPSTGANCNWASFDSWSGSTIESQPRVVSLHTTCLGEHDGVMDTNRVMLRHFLAALAYRTQKAVRGHPHGFGEYRAAKGVRTPCEIVRHMTSVLGYTCTFFEGGNYSPEPLATLEAELERFHKMLAKLSSHFALGPFDRMTPERFLQGPLSDAMTHAGQLAMLRRLANAPVAPENFILADIDSENVSSDQPDPAAPDEGWHTPDGE